MTLNDQEIKNFLLEELKEQRNLYVIGKENNYSYLFMLLNDIGIKEAIEIK